MSMRTLACWAVAAVATIWSGMGFAGTAKAGDLEPLMSRRGDLLLSEEFGGTTLGPQWRVAKGAWKVAGGELSGTELEADHHAAVIRQDLAVHDAIYQFSFRFDGGTRTNLSLNDLKGHVCRVIITPEGFVMNKDADKKTGEKAETIGEAKMHFENGRWYTMLVEVVGGQMLARVDDAHYALGGRASLDRPTTNFGFPTSGAGVSFDNVKVWQALPNPKWDANRKRLQAGAKS